MPALHAAPTRLASAHVDVKPTDHRAHHWQLFLLRLIALALGALRPFPPTLVLSRRPLVPRSVAVIRHAIVMPESPPKYARIPAEVQARTDGARSGHPSSVSSRRNVGPRPSAPSDAGSI